MTTIVATLKGMAADTRVTGPGPFYPATKIFRVGDSLLGTAGHGFMCLAFVDWFKLPRRKPHQLHELIGREYSRDDIDVLELNPSGIYRWNGWGYGEKVLRDHDGIGTGAMAAIEALRRGADLRAAVTAAMGHDEFTGCEVQVEMLKAARARKRPAR